MKEFITIKKQQHCKGKINHTGKKKYLRKARATYKSQNWGEFWFYKISADVYQVTVAISGTKPYQVGAFDIAL